MPQGPLLPVSVSLQAIPVKPSAQMQKKGESLTPVRQVPPFWQWFTSQSSPGERRAPHQCSGEKEAPLMISGKQPGRSLLESKKHDPTNPFTWCFRPEITFAFLPTVTHPGSPFHVKYSCPSVSLCRRMRTSFFRLNFTLQANNLYNLTECE